MWLEGVTSLDSDTDPAPPSGPLSRPAPNSQELERIQDTLRELQAFLYEAGGPGAPERPAQGRGTEQMTGQDTGRELGEKVPPRPPREAPVWQRAMEIEARIRQVGLTPPSLMKRSASLAKLDCLELSTNDLDDWELCPAPHPSTYMSQDPRAPHPHPHPSPDDVWKKQRVLFQSPPTSRGQTVRTGGGQQHLRGLPSPQSPLPDSYQPLSPLPDPSHPLSPRPDPSQPSPPPYHLGEGGEDGCTDPTQTLGCAPTLSVSPGRQQQGKGHPLRRLRKAAEKKRTNTVLYNTM